MSSDLRETAASGFSAFNRPVKTAGLETSVRLTQASTEPFTDAVVGFRPELTPDAVSHEEEVVRTDIDEEVLKLKIRSKELSGTETRILLSKHLPFWRKGKYVKISMLLSEIVCTQSFWSKSAEVIVRLDDERCKPPMTIRSILLSSNTGNRFPFDMDYSVKRSEFKHIVLVISRSSIGMKKGMVWGEIWYKASLTLSNHPKLSAVNPVRGRTLIPAGSLEPTIVDRTRQDNRLSQVGLELLSSIKERVVDETLTPRSTTLRKRTAGTIRGSEGLEQIREEAENFDVMSDDSNDPIVRQNLAMKESESKDMWENKMSVWRTRSTAGSPSVSITTKHSELLDREFSSLQQIVEEDINDQTQAEESTPRSASSPPKRVVFSPVIERIDDLSNRSAERPLLSPLRSRPDLEDSGFL